MDLKRLTPQDFDRVAAKTRLKDRAREMARAVLVDGRAQTDVATQHGMSKQCVGQAVSAIKRAYSKMAARGSGWVTVALELPEALALEMASLVSELKGCSDQAAQSRATTQVVRSIRAARNSLT